MWSVVHVPSLEAEDRRHPHRQLVSLKRDRTRHINRIKGLLASQGLRLAVGAKFLKRLETVCLWDSSPLPSGLCARMEREYAGLRFVEQQIRELEAERRHNTTPPMI